jgi:hypothetical protein
MIVRAFLVLVLATQSAAGAELRPADFAYGMRVITDKPAAAYRVTVPYDLYRAVVHADLSDVRVFNARGESVPYEMRRPDVLLDSQTVTQRLSLVRNGAALEDQPGEFAFDIGAPLPIDRINIELPEPNSVAQMEVLSRASEKEPWGLVARRAFYRLKDRSTEVQNSDLNVPLVSHRYWLLRLDRPEGLGRGVPRLRVGWLPHELIFVARGEEPFTLAYGSGTAESSEAALDAVLPNVRIERARLAQAVDLGGPSRLQARDLFPWRTAALWSVLLLGVGVLAWMAVRLSKELRASAPK